VFLPSGSEVSPARALTAILSQYASTDYHLEGPILLHCMPKITGMRTADKNMKSIFIVHAA
jgi:hypothetical protein